MSRHRILVGVVVVIALALVAAVFSAPADARASAKPVRPKVGQCRTTTYNQAFGTSDAHKPVPCSKPHTLKTFAVVAVRSGST